MICSGRDKIESASDLAKAVDTAKKLSLDALVVTGGDDSITNAAFLAEHFARQGIISSNDTPSANWYSSSFRLHASLLAKDRPVAQLTMQSKLCDRSCKSLGFKQKSSLSCLTTKANARVLLCLSSCCLMILLHG